MRVDLKRLKLLAGQKERLVEKIEGNSAWLKGTQAAFLKGILVELLVEFTGKEWFIRGWITVPLELDCSRCLEKFPYQLKGNFERIVVLTDTKIHNSIGDEDSYLLAEEGSVDLSQAIEETFVLNIPMVPLCNENCAGLCPDCGKNLNFEVCECKDDGMDPRFEKLRELL